jgi:zinc-ribbon domain
MYCPQCATPYSDGAKFCRACGQELEAVALALSSKPVPPAEAGRDMSKLKTKQDWLEQHSAGVVGITKGAILLAVSLLIGAALALFIPSSFDAPWILIWMVFFGWLACWGGIELANGVGGVLEAKGRLRLLRLAARESLVDAPPQQQLPAADARPAITKPTTAFRSAPPLSVTEGTTRQLDDSVEQ